ncbi:hypothetical protein [uncultured Helicobacter sp.]|uniref:hypothetical protein n=1 Tax=uncultured Helicobacter sp. TaxID=175537 RepID=UPI002605F5E3|nr:hypothetical protein [uncultured Helicobacter sp.]
MTLQVQISDQNKEQIINAIKLIKGVKSIQNANITKEVIETKADRKAWLKARKDLEKGKTISLEELERKYL